MVLIWCVWAATGWIVLPSSQITPTSSWAVPMTRPSRCGTSPQGRAYRRWPGIGTSLPFLENTFYLIFSTNLVCLSSHFVNCVAFKPDNPNILVSGSRDKTIKMWDLTSGSCVSTVTGARYGKPPLLYDCPVCGHFTAKCFNTVDVNHANLNLILTNWRFRAVSSQNAIDRTRNLPKYWIQKRSIQTWNSIWIRHALESCVLKYDEYGSDKYDSEIWWNLTKASSKEHVPPLQD